MLRSALLLLLSLCAGMYLFLKSTGSLMLKNGCSISCLSGNSTEYSGAMGRRLLLPSLVGDRGGGGSCLTTIMRALNKTVVLLSNDFFAKDIRGGDGAI